MGHDDIADTQLYESHLSARHCERQRSNPWHDIAPGSKMDCFVAFAPRKDTGVVPAKAGTHTPCRSFERRCSMTFAQQLRPVVSRRARCAHAGVLAFARTTNVTHTSAISRRETPELCRSFPPRNNMRAWGMPGARCT